MPPPRSWKVEIARVPGRTRLRMPAIGMESEFNVWLDGKEIDPKRFWRHPSAFIDRELLPREKSSLQLPTGGAVYFDRGVIEVVTPLIELAPHSTARVVRSLWEQIAFVREQLTRWEQRSGHSVRLKAYSSHYNVSYEIPKRRQNRSRNIQKLALLLAYILPPPVMIVGTNRRSTGVGVRPRGNRIEITVDFTPDPGLMVATATLIVGIVREVMSWPSYDLSLLERLPIPVIAGVVPGKHTTRKGWLTKDIHYARSPYTCDIDDPIWPTQFGDRRSLRQIALDVAWFFRKSIREHSDPFSFRLLFAVLEGRAPSMLELPDRPLAYEDVGRLCEWGMVIDELRAWSHERRPSEAEVQAATPPETHPHTTERPANGGTLKKTAGVEIIRPRPIVAAKYVDRRSISLLPKRPSRDRRRRSDRRRRQHATPFPDRRLTRSAYEQVFLKLVSGSRLRFGNQLYTPVGMRGWYHAVFRSDGGEERILTIDQLLRKTDDWV